MGKSIKVRRRRPIELSENQWRRLNGARGHVFPQFYKWLGTGGTASRRTADKKLTKLYRPPRKRSPKQLIVLLEPKKWRGSTKKNFSGGLCRTGAPPHFCAGLVLPHFQIRSGATADNVLLPLSHLCGSCRGSICGSTTEENRKYTAAKTAKEPH